MFLAVGLLIGRGVFGIAAFDVNDQIVSVAKSAALKLAI
jgi:hypothetical protein